jgi:hypothetical protein
MRAAPVADRRLDPAALHPDGHLDACASQDLIQDGVGGGLFDGQDQVVDSLPGRVTPGSSCKLVWTARRSPARQAGEAATETSSYCPLPASRPSCPGGGSCRPG